MFCPECGNLKKKKIVIPLLGCCILLPVLICFSLFYDPEMETESEVAISQTVREEEEPEAYLSEADSYCQNGDYQRAIDRLQGGVAITSSSRLLERMAQIYRDMSDDYLEKGEYCCRK